MTLVINSPQCQSQSQSALDVAKTLQEMNTVLANSLQSLDLVEREKALGDLHGIIPPGDSNPEEDPVQLQKLFDAMQERIDDLKHGTDYELAEKLDFAYVADPQLRTMFLRSSDYDPHKSAQQMIHFFELKRHIFGVDKLAREITFHDLCDEDKETMNNGSIQILPFGDMSGRDILLCNTSLRNHRTIECEYRAKYCLMMECAKRVFNVRIAGLTVVYFGLDALSVEANELSDLWWSIPCKPVAIHLCTDSYENLVRDCHRLTQFPPQFLARTRLHVGSYEEMHKSLSAFGIPSHLLPARCGDSPTIAHHLQWCKEWEAQTDQPISPYICNGEYNDKDVLFGYIRNHIGNALMRKVAETYQDEYDVAPRAKKLKLAQEVVDQVHLSGGRFLRRNEEGDWVEVPCNKARDKVAHTLRNLRKKQ